MNTEFISEAIGELDAQFVGEAMDFKGRARHAWAKWAACAACLALVIGAVLFAAGRGQSQIPLSGESVGVSARYIDAAPGVSSSASLIYLTEEELFTYFDTAIFRGTIKEIRNIELDFNGDRAYRAIAEIEIERVYRGPCAEGETVKVLLPCPIEQGLWVEDTEVVSAMREGMRGIFMPVIYDRENSLWEQNGAVLIQKDIADYGFADGVRYAFLETDKGLVFARECYETIADAQTLDEVEEYIIWKTTPWSHFVVSFDPKD